MSEYRLYHFPEGYAGNGPWGDLHGTHATLSQAMATAGHTELSYWHTAVDIPDLLFLDWTLYFDKNRDYEDTEYLQPRWVIEAPGVADEFTNRLVSGVVAHHE
jgi:hypothetical protein